MAHGTYHSWQIRISLEKYQRISSSVFLCSFSKLSTMPVFRDVDALPRDTNYALSILTFALFSFVVLILYRLYFHPLSHVPGPWLGRVSSLFIYTICYLGIEGRVLRNYHIKYKTKVIRVAPNSLSISDSSAIQPIYITGGGFQKDARYANFNLGPVVSIFSAIDTEYRDTRAKVVAPLFSPARLRAASGPCGVMKDYVAKYVQQFQAFKTAALAEEHGSVKVDILDLSARLSIDVVTGYLLKECYGGLDENDGLPVAAQLTKTLSANPFIFAIVAFARFSLLPNRLFGLAYSISSRFNADKEVGQSAVLVDNFVERVTRRTSSRGTIEDSYQGRLLAAGIALPEVVTQSKAIIFAGADSVAVMLTTILFHLVRKADVRARLLQEIRSDYKDAVKEAEALPYLRAVVKEGLRLGMANPTRFTRVVPSCGVRVGSVYIPPGTVVGCAPYILHHDEEVFPRPFEFLPERWFEDGEDGGLQRPDMQKSMLAFGAGLRACIGKSLAQRQLHETVAAIVDSEVLEGARTCQERIEIVEWFNGEIKGHKLEIQWSPSVIR